MLIMYLISAKKFKFEFIWKGKVRLMVFSFKDPNETIRFKYRPARRAHEVTCLGVALKKSIRCSSP